MLQARNFIKKKTPTQVFPCEYCEIFNNNFFIAHLWWLLLILWLTHYELLIWGNCKANSNDIKLTSDSKRTFLVDKNKLIDIDLTSVAVAVFCWPFFRLSFENICEALRDFAPFLQFKNVKNTDGGLSLLVELQTQRNTPPWVYFHVSYKWDQIAKSITNEVHFFITRSFMFTPRFLIHSLLKINPSRRMHFRKLY